MSAASRIACCPTRSRVPSRRNHQTRPRSPRKVRAAGRISFGTIFVARQHTGRDIDIAILSVCLLVRLSVRHIPVLYRNGLTYRHNFFAVR